jgi:uncharacterized protein YbaR (Trm112 family)/SAM-dependent methyltransferase
MPELKMSPTVLNMLCCPNCGATLKLDGERFTCEAPKCAANFPIIDGIPIMISDKSSIFSIDDFTSHHSTTFNLGKNKLKEALVRIMPDISSNIKAKRNYAKLTALLCNQSVTPTVLIIGGSVLGKGMESLTTDDQLELVETDVSFGPRTKLICDAHDIPFCDETFDCVIVQAVLEHVVDPYRCVEEIYRVLKKQGFVYSETPFMQQVHMGRYDFTRFTHLGHRRLFNKFDEIDSGAACGPGMALAWSYQYFLRSFVVSKTLLSVIRVLSSLTSFFLKYFDYYLIDKPGAFDAAAGYYFMGRKGSRHMSDKELLTLYKGTSRS